MIKTTLAVDGMQCSMCESHINEVIRKNFQVKKVTSSHKKGQTEILSEEPLDEQKIREAIKETGYSVGNISSETSSKKGFLFW